MSADNSINTIHEEANMHFKTISWDAIFAGLISTLVIELVLLILGTAVGASSIFPLNDTNPLANIAIGPIIWISISMMIALAIGSYLSGIIATREGVLHGMLVWAIKTLICLTLICILFTHVISGTMSLLGTGLEAASKSASVIAGHASKLASQNLPDNNINLDDLKSELINTMHNVYEKSLTQNSGSDQILSPSQAPVLPSKESIDNDIIQWLQAFLQRNKSSLQTEDRENFKKILKSHLRISDSQAENLVQKVEEIYHTWKSKVGSTAKKAAYKTAHTISKASWFLFFLIIVEAIIAGTMAQLGYRNKNLFYNR
ncbi:MAG: hypothetical protein V9819_00925 [Candidatus Dasytiphilus stammeri]